MESQFSLAKYKASPRMEGDTLGSGNILKPERVYNCILVVQTIVQRQ